MLGWVRPWVPAQDYTRVTLETQGAVNYSMLTVKNPERLVIDIEGIEFAGLQMGIFEGSIRYVFFPGSRLVEQAAVMHTREPDTAYFYDAGLSMTVEADRLSAAHVRASESNRGPPW